MKPDATMVQSTSSGTQVGVSLNNAASILNFCVQNNIAVRGHTLVWHSQSPEWFFKENFSTSGNWVSTSVMDQRLENYIKAMFELIETQYPTLNLYAYDVANECISDSGGARTAGTGSGQSKWVQVYGDNSFIEKAFTYARKYAPEGCSLFYNDYNEYMGQKMTDIVSLVTSLYNKGVLDGMGMQSHVGLTWPDAAGYKTALNNYKNIGCEIQVTELDVGDASTQSAAANRYKEIVQAIVDTKNAGGNVTALCVWGTTGDRSWIQSSSAYPLLFDSSYNSTEAYSTIKSIIPESDWGDGDSPSGSTDPIEPDENGYYFHDTFEGSVSDWVARGGATIQTSGRTAYKGSEALLMMDRTSAWNGAQKSLNARAFVPGNSYSFSVNAEHFDGNNPETLQLKLQYEDSSGTTQYSTIATAEAKPGAWVQLANTNYTIPSDATNMYFYVESAENTMNFYIDEAIGAVGGTFIDSPALGTNQRGDVDNNDIINSIDVSLAKQGMFKGFTDSNAKTRADIDGDGDITYADITLLKEFVLGKITEFPEIVPVIDVEEMESIFASVTAATSYKSAGSGNPLMTQKFGADPGVMVYNGRVYVYMTNDAFEYDSSGNIVENSYAVTTINCLSSSDLVNWTDHGSIPAAGSSGAATWASRSWAPAAAYKNINGQDKFFLYFANNANGVGVLTSDSPTGPWTDPIGQALISRSTPNCSDVTWLFDPAVFVDDDGTGYLYFGGGVPDGQSANPKTARVVKLGADMVSLSGDPQTIDAPYLFEDSGINKIGNTYYYSYCTNWSTSGNSLGISSASIAYMTSSSPMGPFTFAGEFFKNPGSFGSEFGSYGNNHHTVVEFKGKYYLFYHSRGLETSMGISYNYRSTHVDELTVNNGKLEYVTATMSGVSQVETLNPYNVNRAATIYRQGGLNVRGVGDTIVTDIQKGDWLGVSGVAFTNGASEVKVKVSSTKDAAIKICKGGENGTVVGYVDVPSTGGSFVEITAPVSGLSGTQDIYFVFSDTMEFESWSFS